MEFQEWDVRLVTTKEPNHVVPGGRKWTDELWEIFVGEREEFLGYPSEQEGNHLKCINIRCDKEEPNYAHSYRASRSKR